MQIPTDEMYDALVRRDSEYDGLFYFGVVTTGVFCRSVCSARKPLKKNVRFYTSSADALSAGFRPCKICRPLEATGKMPPWLESVVNSVEQDPSRKWTDQDLRELDVDPIRIRRWFQTHHGITFHSFLRSRRLAQALSQLSIGNDITQTAYDAGYESVSGFRTAFQQWFGQAAGAAGKQNEKESILVNRLLSPLGPMVVAADENHLYLLEFADRRMLETQFKRLARYSGRTLVPGENLMMEKIQSQLDEYFEGTRKEFELPLWIAGTEFQETVWRQLLKIDYGKTVSYEWIAKHIDNPNAQRAVGKANGDNRLAIVIPCHRVIRQNGELSGYGGGVRRKQWMLELEMAHSDPGSKVKAADRSSLQRQLPFSISNSNHGS